MNDTLPDDELVRCVAEECMNGVVRFAYKVWWIGEQFPQQHKWRPLESWDDTMVIVAAMRAKGWRFDMHDRLPQTLRNGTQETMIAFERSLGDDGRTEREVAVSATADETAQRRAILRAALIAVQKGAEG